MKYNMKLMEKPFENMKKGIKTVEFRLRDEKRKNIKVGDQIEFSKLPDLKEKLVVEVLDLYVEDNFKELFERVYADPKIVEEHMKLIYQIYSKEEEKEYGVLGIKIRVI